MTFAKLFKNNPEYVERCRNLRLESTKSEKVLWYELRGRRLGYKFRRQFSIDEYIVDFYCEELRLIIELDGPIHDVASQHEYDKNRENKLRVKNYFIKRYKNDEVLFKREKVLSDIMKTCQGLFKKKNIII